MNISENYKKIILAAVVIILAIAGIFYYNKIKNRNENAKPNFITEKDPNLTAEERKTAEDRLAAVEEKIKNPPEGTAVIEKYGWNLQAGLYKLNLGKFLEAKNYFLTASGLQPDDYTSYMGLYEAYLRMTDYDSARENIKKALALNSGNLNIWQKYIQLEKEKFDPATGQMEQIFSQALKSTRDNIDIITAYAQYLEEKGELKGAMVQWKKAAIINAANKDVYQAEISRLEGLIK